MMDTKATLSPQAERRGQTLTIMGSVERVEIVRRYGDGSILGPPRRILPLIDAADCNRPACEVHSPGDDLQELQRPASCEVPRPAECAAADGLATGGSEESGPSPYIQMEADTVGVLEAPFTSDERDDREVLNREAQTGPCPVPGRVRSSGINYY